MTRLDTYRFDKTECHTCHHNTANQILFKDECVEGCAGCQNRSCMMRKNDEYLVHRKALVQFAKTLCRVLAVFHGWQYRSKFVANMSFMGYNKGLEGRTTHDWLNRDQAEVDKYLADERCTFTFTLNAYYSMFSGILRLHDPAFLAKMPKGLPLLFLAGDADPVGEQGKGVQRAIQSLKDAGVQNIECKLYPGARHELLVETNHQEVFEDIGSWLEKHLA